jgi:hypothetical protein
MDVYWSIDHKRMESALNVQTPELVLKNKPMSETRYNICPAFKDYFHNVYGWKAMYAYSLEKSGDRHDYVSNFPYAFEDNQEAMNRNIHIRSVDEQVISISQYVLFVTDRPSLLLSQENPSFEDNKFTSSCYVIPGTLDIGKYFKALDFAFHIKKNHSKSAFDEGDIIYYLRFHTPEKINFKQYFMNDKLREYEDMINGMKAPFSAKPLSFFYGKYKKFNLKSKILKEIKNNII